MASLNEELRRLNFIPDFDKHEELMMNDDSDPNPIQRRILLKRVAKRQAEEADKSAFDRKRELEQS